jgi:hypothetical protein
MRNNVNDLWRYCFIADLWVSKKRGRESNYERRKSKIGRDGRSGWKRY